MAEDTDLSRSEAPTEHRRQEARDQGRFAVSAEVNAGLLILVGVLMIGGFAEDIGGGLLSDLHQTCSGLKKEEMTTERAAYLLAGMALRGTGVAGTVLGVLFATGLGVSVLQVGFHLNPALLQARWEKLSFAGGASRLLSVAGIVRGLFFLLKMSLILAMAYWVLRGQGLKIVAAGESGLATAVAHGWQLAQRLALVVAAALLILGVADYAYQRWRHEVSLRMSRQEMKDEVKREEGDPQIKARIRKVQRENSKKRMLLDVPRATVVITNPTHLAVALRYDRGVNKAPRVVAKGAGAVARRIVTLARNHAVPVVERKPVAQALYKAVRVGQEIPGVLYYAVAEVLAFVYRLRGTAA